MQHDVRFEAGHPGELLVTHRTGRVLPIVRAFMKRQVELNVERLGALVTSMWLVGERSQEATETLSFHSEGHSSINRRRNLRRFQGTWTSFLDSSH